MPCIYYDEQGFVGQGGDNQMREAMFDKASPGTSLLNTGCSIYQRIAVIATVMRANAALRFGRMYYRQISGNGIDFGLPFGSTYTLAFSRILYPTEVLVVSTCRACRRTTASLSMPGCTRSGTR